MLDVAEHI